MEQEEKYTGAKGGDEECAIRHGGRKLSGRYGDCGEMKEEGKQKRGTGGYWAGRGA